MVSLQSNMPSNIQNQEDLVALFSRNLTFDSEQQAAMIIRQQLEQAHAEAQIQAEEHTETQAQAMQQEPPQQAVYSISQHYNHSCHLAKQQQQQQQQQEEQLHHNQQNLDTVRDIPRPSSVPPENGTAAAEFTLRNHGVNPTLLTPSQLQLFRVAESDQQLRLMELWSICPPSGAENIASLAWSSTSLEQEEQLARARYERTQQQETSMAQGDDGRWAQQSPESEPYMTAGYEAIMQQGQDAYNSLGSAAGPNYQRAMDPVYLGPDYARQLQQIEMASQYGAFEQLRGNGQADAMDVM